MAEATLLERLRSSELLSAGQLVEIEGLPEASNPDPKILARIVLQRGWLTKFQVSQVATGKGKELFVGPYVLLDRLGEGGMGQVFKARHRHMKRLVALKLIRKEKLASADAVSRFYQEVEAAAQLHHPNIVLAFDAGQAGSTHFFSMEYVEGPDLTRLVKEKGALPVAQACDFIRQAAIGLQHAHQRGLVHRDIKPSNLLVTTSEGAAVVKILDLGLARLGDTFAKDRNLTKMGQVMGTPDYIAPEQALDARHVDIRADIYSLGCSLYFLLAKRPPFQAESLTELLMKHQMEEPPSLRSLRPDVPEALEVYLRRMMAKKPQDRPNTPEEVATALESFARGESGRLSQLPPVLDIPPLAPSRTWAGLSAHDTMAEQPRNRGKAKKSNKPLLIGGVLGGLAIAGVVIGIILWAMRPASTRQEGTTVARADSEKDKKPREKAGTPEPKQEVPKPTPLIKEPIKRDPPIKEPKEVPVDEERRFKGHTGPVLGVAFSPDGRRLLSGSEDATARLWDRATGKVLQVFSGHTSHVRGGDFSPDGKRVVTVSDDKSIRLWDVDSGKEIGRLTGHTGFLKSAVFSPDGKRVLSCGDDFTMRLWDAELRCELRRFDHPSWVRRAVFSPDGRYAFTGCSDGNCRVWSLQSGREYRRLQGSGDAYTCAFLGDGHRVLSGSFDTTLRLWDLSTGRLLHHLQGHRAAIWGLAVSPNDRCALSCSLDKTVRLWDLKKGTEIKQYPFDCRNNPAFSPDGRYALCGGEDNLLHLWRLPMEAAGTREPVKRPVLPDADALAKAVNEIKERFQADYSRKTVADRTALATKLQQLGLDTTDAQDLRYAYLREARDLAARAGNFSLSRKVIDDLSFFYAADELESRSDALKVAAQSGSADRAAVAADAVEVMEDAVEADNYAIAEAALSIASTAVLKTNNQDLLQRVIKSRTRVVSLRKEYAAVQKSIQALAGEPDSPEANLALGKFQCFYKDDWIKGLILVTSGSDPALAALARKDLANPIEPKDQAEVGHGWWDQARKETGIAQRRMRKRARRFFQRALPLLTDIERVKVDDKLKVVKGRFVGKPGLVAEYFADEAAGKKVMTRRDYQVDFNWGTGSPAEGIPADHFSVRWQGWLVVPKAGKYTLYVHADDGTRLFLDRKLVPVIDNWAKGGRQAVTVFLTDKPHHLRIEFREGIGTAMMIFGWVDGGTDKVVPMEWLYHDEEQEKLLGK